MDRVEEKLKKALDWEHLSVEEKLAFEEWFKQDRNRSLIEAWADSDQLQRDLILLSFLRSRRKDNYKKLIKRIERPSKYSFSKSWRRFMVAASVLFVLCGVGIYLFTQNNWLTDDAKYISRNYSPALLNVSPSMEYKLNKHCNNVEINGVRIHMEQNKIAYNSIDEQANAVIADSLLMNELVVPRGRMCEVVLVDGTRIKLNSDSRLRYPISFSDSVPRMVYLEGEAYFEVQSDPSHPFIVKTPDIETFVYGTKFNVKAYNDDYYCVVTLEEGHLRVIRNDGRKDELQPGDMYEYKKYGDSSIRHHVDVNNVTCWMENRFFFDNQSLWNITKDIERKYDVHICFDSPATSNLKFYSLTPKCEHVETVLNLIKLTHKIDYTVKGRNIYVKKNN